jgi:transcriptional regulator with XRE-family HTH domain
MIHEFSLDLRAARRNSGLRQVDCAHLMGADKSKISNLERGRQHPTVRDICTLSTLPDPKPNYKRRQSGERTLQKLEERIVAIEPEYDDD